MAKFPSYPETIAFLVTLLLLNFVFKNSQYWFLFVIAGGITLLIILLYKLILAR